MKKNSLFTMMVIAMAFLIDYQAMAQEPDFLFERPIPFTTQPAGMGWKVEPRLFPLEIPNNESYLVTVNPYEPKMFYMSESEFFPPIVYKLSSQGEVLDSLALGYGDSYTFVSRLMLNPEDGTCLALGKFYDRNCLYDRLFMAKFDYDMNLLWQREIALPDDYHKHFDVRSAIVVDGEVFSFLSYDEYPSNPTHFSHVLYIKISPEGLLEGFFEYPETSLNFDYADMFQYSDGSETIGHVLCDQNEGDHVYSPHLIKFNRELEMVGRTSIHQNNYSLFEGASGFGITWISVAHPVSDNSVIYGGSAVDHSEGVIGFIKVDEEGNISTYCTVGASPVEGQGRDSLRITQGLKCSDVSGDDAFVFFYRVGDYYGMGYDYTDHFVVVKMDFDGNILWKRFWNQYQPENDMMVYVPQSIVSISDGGCLIGGYCYHSDLNDKASQSNSSDPIIFLLKVFADGTLSTPETEMGIRPYAFYPNPVGDCLGIQFSPDVTPTLVELYDAQGRLVMRQKASLESVNTTGLKAGLYTVKVTLSDGKSYSDSVIKK